MKFLFTSLLMLCCYVCNAQVEEMSLVALFLGSQNDTIVNFYDSVDCNIKQRKHKFKVYDDICSITFKVNNNNIAYKADGIFRDQTDEDYADLFKEIQEITQCTCTYQGPKNSYFFYWEDLYIRIFRFGKYIEVKAKLL